MLCKCVCVRARRAYARVCTCDQCRAPAYAWVDNYGTTVDARKVARNNGLLCGHRVWCLDRPEQLPRLEAPSDESAEQGVRQEVHGLLAAAFERNAEPRIMECSTDRLEVTSRARPVSSWDQRMHSEARGAVGTEVRC